MVAQPAQGMSDPTASATLLVNPTRSYQNELVAVTRIEDQ